MMKKKGLVHAPTESSVLCTPEGMNKVEKKLLSIVFFVVILHIAAVLWLVVDGSKQPSWDKEAKRQIAVKSVIFSPITKEAHVSESQQVTLQRQQKQKPPPSPKQIAATAPKPAPIKQQAAAPAKVVKEPVEKVPKQKEVQKQNSPIKAKAAAPAPSPTPALIEAEVQNKKDFQEKQEQKNALLQRAKESIAKIPQPSEMIASARFSAAADLTAQQRDSAAAKGAVCLSPEGCYAAELAAALQRQLSLPEWGRVEVELTINRQGKVMKVTILKAESVKNRSYLEGALPKVTAAAFGTRFATADSHTFILTLTN